MSKAPLRSVVVVLYLATGWLLGLSPLLFGQEIPVVKKAEGGTPAPLNAASIDPKFHSPRATVRTFLIAINQTADDPHKIDDAVACLDLSGLPPDRHYGGRLALSLEYVLRSTNIPTVVIPDSVEGTECTIGEGKEIKLTLRRMPDERWLFDSKTLLDLPRMRLYLWQRDLAAGREKDNSDVPADFRSPFAMFHTYLDALKKGDTSAAADCLDLTEIPDPARKIVGRALAYKLKEVLDRTNYILLQDLPDSSVGIPLDAFVHKEGRITGERQASGPRKGQWLFNKATVRSIDHLYNAFESKPLVPELIAMGEEPRSHEFSMAPGLWLRHRIPASLKYRVAKKGPLSFALYQFLGLTLLILLVLPTYRVIVWPLKRILSALLQRRGSQFSDQEIKGGIRPLGWLAAIGMLIEGITLLDLKLETAGWLLATLVPAFWVAATVAAYQLIDPIIKLVAGPAATQEGATTLAAMGFPVLSLVLKILVVACGLAAILSLFEFDVTTVLTGLGIGGLAFALAAQDTLKNFFGSVMLIADRTFRVGDLVRIGENEGTVESVGLRTTRIRGLDDSLLTIPNSDLTTAHVTNFGARRYRRYRTRLTVPYGISPERLIQFRDGILALVRNHPQARLYKSEVALNDIEASGIEILVQVFFDVPDAHAEFLARDQLILGILRLAEQLEITFDSPMLVLEREKTSITNNPASISPIRDNHP